MFENLGNMSELSAIQLVLAEMRAEGMKDGGMIDKPLGSGGVKSGPPPKRGPNPQGLNVPLKQVKTIKLEKLNGRNRQVASQSGKNRSRSTI